MGLHAHLTVKHHTQVTNSTSGCHATSFDVDVNDISLASLMSSSNDYEFICSSLSINILCTIHYSTLTIHLDVVDHYISTILATKLKCQV